MAYGKNKAVAAAVGNFRQQSKTFTSNKRPGQRRSGVPYFVDKYEPSIGSIDTIRLVPGEHLQHQIIADEKGEPAVQDILMPYIKFVEHFDGSNRKGCICSAGPFASYKEKRQPCHGCDIFWETCVRSEGGGLKSTRISRQNKFAFSVFDYSVYHKIEVFDRDSGKVRMNTRTNEPYYNWTKCLGQGCDACRAKKESKVGDMRHWPLNYSQFEVLREQTANIEKSCSKCLKVDCIASLGWVCAQCGECAVEVATTDLKRDELNQLTDAPYQCACGFTGFLQEIYECKHCSAVGEEGVRATLFDVDLRVTLVEVQDKKMLQLVGWSAPGEPAAEFIELMKPVNLLEKYAPDDLTTQAERFDVRRGSSQAQGAAAGGAQTASPPAARAYQNPYNKPQA